MKKLISLIILTLLFTIASSAYDYKFEMSEKYINGFIDSQKEALVDSGLHNFEVFLVGERNMEIELNYGMLRIPVKIKMTLDTVSPNKFRLFITKFKVLGFLPMSRMMIAEAVRDSIITNPFLAKCINIRIFKLNTKSDEDFGVDINFTKSPVDILE
ncbi:MAG: hypothetical protein M0Q02_12370, partial [Candidatus Muirbacterium halophilum]|nr:hypothetical protein [Candidatus Muirbacterium halophilum]